MIQTTWRGAGGSPLANQKEAPPPPVGTPPPPPSAPSFKLLVKREALAVFPLAFYSFKSLPFLPCLGFWKTGSDKTWIVWDDRN